MPPEFTTELRHLLERHQIHSMCKIHLNGLVDVLVNAIEFEQKMANYRRMLAVNDRYFEKMDGK